MPRSQPGAACRAAYAVRGLRCPGWLTALPALRLPGPQMHYTWGSVFNAPNGTKVWEFDKRYYTEPKHEKTVRAGCGCVAGWMRWCA